jgi:hypothetical protein
MVFKLIHNCRLKTSVSRELSYKDSHPRIIHHMVIYNARRKVEMFKRRTWLGKHYIYILSSDTTIKDHAFEEQSIL